ncbi:ImpA family type VI secretion system protein [Collimonas humicola]|uniref:type VI secretion system protein TssA n=1 Tax=Collimonas humicola TaxID=2825886 RepID=UPI001B8B4533|nr:type VI secretion system ImpA family N-terminal domain-containing protein [Collimonas humicola]
MTTGIKTMRSHIDLLLPNYSGSENIEFSEDFQQIDGMINSHDSDGHSPLRKGEKPFQWHVVESGSKKLLEKCPDLRVGVWLLRANLMTKNLTELTESVSLLAGLMRLPADSIFPQAGDRETPREVHAIALTWLAREQFLHCLQSVKIWRDSEVSLNDLAIAADLSALFRTHSMSDVSDALESIKNRLHLILDALKEEGNLVHYDFSKATEYLERIAGKLSAWPPASQERSVVEKDEASKEIVQITTTREEVQKQLEDLIQYFRINEPGHPAPIFLLRVQRMIGASFEELMAELYLDAGQLVARLEGPQVAA